MADSMVQVHAKEFSDNIMLLLRQGTSKMLGKVMMKNGLVGDEFTQERIGIWAMSDKTQGVQSTPINDPGMSRRTGRVNTFNDARQYARDDELRTKVQLSSPWVKASGSALGIKIDTIVFDAFGGDAFSGKNGETAVPLPAGQKIATDAGVGITTELLVEIKTKMDSANVPLEGRRVMIHPEDLNTILLEDKATSADYNDVKMLKSGEASSWMGFEWISCTAATAGVAYFYHEDGLCLAMNESPYVDIRTRHDLSDAREIYYELTAGATRLEEERVVEVTFTPAV